ncbi:MAG: hypothetical protein GY893_10620, partial [bacterium]|nr:hypothetical protein [bacterium]
ITQDAAPITGGDVSQAYCTDETGTVDLNSLISPLNGTVTWNPSSSIDLSKAVAGDYIFTVTGSGSCSSSSVDGKVTITQDAAPFAGNDIPVQYCSDDAVIDVSTLLTGANSGGTWLSTTLFDPANKLSESFKYVIQGSGACVGLSDTSTVSASVLIDFAKVGLASNYIEACEGQLVNVRVVDSLGGGSSPVYEWFLNSKPLSLKNIAAKNQYTSTNQIDTVVVKMISSSQCGNPEVYDTLYVKN